MGWPEISEGQNDVDMDALMVCPAARIASKLAKRKDKIPSAESPSCISGANPMLSLASGVSETQILEAASDPHVFRIWSSSILA